MELIGRNQKQRYFVEFIRWRHRGGGVAVYDSRLVRGSTYPVLIGVGVDTERAR